MRIWDIHPSRLCRAHLLGEHRELHGLYVVLARGPGSGYWNHPETQRWVGKERALERRHERLAAEIANRGYRHGSDLSPPPASSSDAQDAFIHTLEEQRRILVGKACACRTEGNLTQPA